MPRKKNVLSLRNWNGLVRYRELKQHATPKSCEEHNSEYICSLRNGVCTGVFRYTSISKYSWDEVYEDFEELNENFDSEEKIMNSIIAEFYYNGNYQTYCTVYLTKRPMEFTESHFGHIEDFPKTIEMVNNSICKAINSPTPQQAKFSGLLKYKFKKINNGQSSIQNG